MASLEAVLLAAAVAALGDAFACGDALARGDAFAGTRSPATHLATSRALAAAESAWAG